MIGHQLNVYQEYLETLIGFRSISTDAAYRAEIRKAVDFLADLLKKQGFKVEVFNHPRLNPVIWAGYEVDSCKPTVLIYGHYDVQPASEEDWGYDPFKLTTKNGRFYGRGVADNKGQLMIHLVSVFALIKEKRLGFNVKFLIEGNEETGMVEELMELIEANKDKVRSDYVLISDGEMVGNRPAIEASFRGGFNAKLEYRVAKSSVHSGIYGGAVVNAAHQLMALVRKVVDENNRVKLPGFYDKVDPVEEKVLENNRKLTKLGGEFWKEAGFKSLRLGKGDDFYTATGLYPTVQVTGFRSGYTGAGFANIVPSEAEVRLNFRLVSWQKAEEVCKQFEKFVAEHTPSEVEYRLEVEGLHDPVKLDVNQEIFQRVRKILEKVYGGPILYHHVGGAIPFIAGVKKLFGIDTVSVGLANQDCRMHGVGENLKVELVEKGLEFSYRFLSGGDQV